MDVSLAKINKGKNFFWAYSPEPCSLVLKVVHIAADGLIPAVSFLPCLGLVMANQLTRVFTDELASREATSRHHSSPLSLHLNHLQATLVSTEKLFSNFFKFLRLKKIIAKYLYNIPEDYFSNFTSKMVFGFLVLLRTGKWSLMLC